MTITVSVPGKIHLMGEHAVVHGKPALLSAVNKRMYVTVRDETKGNKKLTINTNDADEYARYIVDFFQKELNIKLPPLVIDISSGAEPGFHLGTSAMTAVGVIAALLYFSKKIWNPERVNQLAYEVEKHQHGTPSGGDNTAVTFGGLLWYRKELEFLKSMWQLPFKPKKTKGNFFLISTTRPKESTGELIAMVHKKVKADPNAMELVFAANEKQTRRLAVGLKEGNEQEIIDAIKAGEQTLEIMGVVSAKAKKFIRSIEASGGAAKILGGGGAADGVGCVLCYHKSGKIVKKLSTNVGYTSEVITLGEEGLRLEKK